MVTVGLVIWSGEVVVRSAKAMRGRKQPWRGKSWWRWGRVRVIMMPPESEVGVGQWDKVGLLEFCGGWDGADIR